MATGDTGVQLKACDDALDEVTLRQVIEGIENLTGRLWAPLERIEEALDGGNTCSAGVTPDEIEGGIELRLKKTAHGLSDLLGRYDRLADRF